MVTVPSVVTSAAAASAPATGASATSGASSTNSATLASNFQTFLQLLTTQLQNQNPLDPLDTNQFTQQLVQFAQVEQQLKSNDQLASLVAIQKTAQSTQALSFVGSTAVVAGSKARLAGGQAAWSLTAPQSGSATVNVISATGATVFSSSYNVDSGPNTFVWNGKGPDGTPYPDGDYTVAVTATDTSGQSMSMTTDVQGIVDSVDLSSNPPMLSIGGQMFTMEQIKRVVAPGY